MLHNKKKAGKTMQNNYVLTLDYIFAFSSLARILSLVAIFSLTSV